MGKLLTFRAGHLMEQTKITFGEWLKEKRQAAGLSLRQAAERAGVSKQYVNIIERGLPHSESKAIPRPSLKVVDALAKSVGAAIPEARLMAGYAPAETEPSDVEQRRLLFYFNDLPEPAKSDALAMMEALWRSQQARIKAQKLGAKPAKKRA